MLHHIDPPMAGHALTVLSKAGLELAECHVFGGQELPRIEEIDGLVIFGGRESVRDLDEHPPLAAECDLIGRAVQAEVPVLGLCLGSQLLARSQGARVQRMERRQIGWAKPPLLDAAADDPLFAGAPPIPALHWNEDAFELPAGAVELQERAGPGVEAFRVGRCAWGTQYHPEVDADILDTWYAKYSGMLAEAGTTEEAARREAARHLEAQKIAAEHLFGAFARVVEARTRRASPVEA